MPLPPTRRTFSLADTRRVLAATPSTLTALLAPFPDDWTRATEGGDTWSARDVVAHLIHGERTDWMPRVHHLRTHGDAVPFPPFDRTAHLSTPSSVPVGALLDEFATLRRASLDALDALQLRPADLDDRGLHPALGPVTLQQLIATWMVHDLDHVMQIARVLATSYTDAVGPWREYLRIVREERLA